MNRSTLSVAVIGAGEMGSAVSKRVQDGGMRVKTSVTGRSAATRERIAKLGIPTVDSLAALIEGADLILSIVPPGQAVSVAEEVAAIKPRASAERQAFVELNAVAPVTARRIASIVEAAGYDCIDGGIMGGPPKPGYSPVIAVSGKRASLAIPLRECELDIRDAGEKIGSASSLKMSYASLTKGFGALMTLTFLHAQENGIEEQFASIFRGVDELWGFGSAFVPRMFPKAHRFVAEMQEISTYMEPDAAGRDIYAAIASLYERVAGYYASEGSEGNQALKDLRELLQSPVPVG